MRRAETLPLGIDAGAARTRVALVERDAEGRARLTAVATRPTGADAARAIADAWAELRTRERRCVLSLGVPDAVLRVASFPADAQHGARARRSIRSRAIRAVSAARNGGPARRAR